MRREDYITRKKPQPPVVSPGQTWKAILSHDFGKGVQSYSIHIDFQDPINKLWHCSYILGTQQVTIVVNWVNSSAHTTILSQEQIEEHFEFQAATPLATPQPFPGIIPNTTPNFIPPNPKQWQYVPMEPMPTIPTPTLVVELEAIVSHLTSL